MIVRPFTFGETILVVLDMRGISPRANLDVE